MFAVKNVVTCVAAESGPSVAPCADVNGQAMHPVALELSSSALNLVQAGEMFAWSLTIVLTVWLVGCVVGSIIRLIQST